MIKTIVYFPGLNGNRTESSEKITFLKKYLDLDSSRVFTEPPESLPEDGNVLVIMKSEVVEDFEAHLDNELVPIMKRFFRGGRNYKCIYVGTSLGGMYAVCLANMFNVPCVVTNPCLSPSRSLHNSFNLKEEERPRVAGFSLTSEALLSLVRDNHPDCIFIATCKDDEVVKEEDHVPIALGNRLNAHVSYSHGGHGFEPYARIKGLLEEAFDLSCDEGPLI